MSTLNGQSMFISAIAGLSNNFSILAQGTSGGLTLSDITNPNSEKVNVNSLNQSFVSYLTSNFSKIDKNGDGTITASDMNEYLSKINSQGLSYQEISTLSAQGGASSSLMATVLNHFSEIDTNGDGKVTNAEIKAFGYKADEEKMKTKYKSFNPNSFSTFYGNDAASYDYEPTSVLDSRYSDI